MSKKPTAVFQTSAGILQIGTKGCDHCTVLGILLGIYLYKNI